MSGERPFRGWEYAKGDYHRAPDPNWQYTPTYLRKMAWVRRRLAALPAGARVLDAACGEGILVEEFRARGLAIEGLDLNYESDHVRRGDLRALPYEDGAFDAVLCLDAIEHIAPAEQAKVLGELRRVLRPDGRLVISFPNLDHLNSRFLHFRCGEWDRTDRSEDHPGERCHAAMLALLAECGLAVEKRRGVTLTVPWFYRERLCRETARWHRLHDALEPLAVLLPSLSLITLAVCRRAVPQPQRGRVSRAAKRALRRETGCDNLFAAPTQMTERERVLLYRLARTLPPEAVAVEIGSYLGASAGFIATGLDPVTGVLHAVDTWTNIGMAEGTRDTFEEFRNHVRQFDRRIIAHREPSVQAADKFTGAIDLLFIDGGHDYGSVRADLEAWLRRLRTDGILALHDYDWAEGVRRAVRELVVARQSEPAHRVDSLYWARLRPVAHRASLHASVIIPTCGRPLYLRDCVAAVLTQDFPPDRCEILVVDNDPQPQAQSIVEELQARAPMPLRYFHEPRPGLHHARHRGAREAQGAILAYLDDDTLVSPTWLAAMVAAFDDPEVGVVAGRVEAQWEGERPEWLDQLPPTYLSLLDLGPAPRELAANEAAHGCNHAVRRDALFEAGGYNPDSLPARLIWQRGDGESGLCHKVRAAGYRLMYEPRAVVKHRIPAARLTREYFLRRAWLDGLSDSFAEIRSIDQVGYRLRRGAINVCLSVIKSLRYRINAWRHPTERYAMLGWAHYWRGRAAHELRVLLRPSLRRHVLASSYWEG